MLEHQRKQDPAQDPKEVKSHHDRRPQCPWEKGRGEQSVDGQLGRAGHKGGEQNGHTAVPLTGESAGGHDGRHRTAEPDQHRHKAAARQADPPQQLVHDKGHPRHVAGVFQDGQEEEQGDDGGQKAQHTADAGKDSVDDQRVDHRVDGIAGQGLIHQPGQRVDPQREQVGQKGADGPEGHPEDQRQDADEAGQRRIFAGQDLVDGHAALVFPAFGRVHHRFGAQLFDEGKAHVRQRGLPVQAALGLHLGDGMFQQILFVLVQAQRFQDQRVPFHQFGGGEARRQSRSLGVVLDQMDHRMDAAVNRPAPGLVPVAGLTEINAARRLPVTRHMDGVVDQLVDALVFGG